jgi:hypothetical protein
MKSAAGKKVKQVNARMTVGENQAFEVMAARLKISRPRLLRKVIREVIGKGPELLPQDFRAFEDALFQLSAVGRNLNQLMRAIHGGQVKVLPPQLILLDDLRGRIESLKQEILTLTGPAATS